MRLVRFAERIRHFVIRHWYDRCVWAGDRRQISIFARAIELIFRITGIESAILLWNHFDTKNILLHFPEVDIPFTAELADSEEAISDSARREWTSLLVNYVRGVQKISPGSTVSHPEFSIIIPFFYHLDYLKFCLESVQRATLSIDNTQLEILIINDDPSVAPDLIRAGIPSGLYSKTRVIQNPRNLGICTSLNRAIQEARYPWILHLDCDDLLSDESLKVLKCRIRRYPNARYISSRMIDIDSEGCTLRCRIRKERPSDIVVSGMVAGHLKAIRRDLFDQIGLYQAEYEGCQDYEFALRVSIVEPILFIPDYLYKYRWHGNTQSVSKAQRQAETTRKIIDTYLIAIQIIVNHRFPVAINITGPLAHEWKGKLIQKSSTQNVISATVHKPFNEINRRLFAIQIARWYIEHRSKMHSIPSVVF